MMPDSPMPIPEIEVLKELTRKLQYALTTPINNWRAEGKAIVHASGDGPLIRDHAASSQSIVLIAEALNFIVRRKMLDECNTELESLIPAIEKGIAEAEDRIEEAWKARTRILMGDKDKLKAEITALTTLGPCGHPKACWAEADTICENCNKGQSTHGYYRTGKTVDGECNNFRGDDRHAIPAHCTACVQQEKAVRLERAAALREAASIASNRCTTGVEAGNRIRALLSEMKF